MSVCACGRTTNDGQSACDRCTALASFGLTRDATQVQIKDAYRVLAKVWHPDRFQSDEQLRRKAEEKLKEINSAYQLLTTNVAEGPDGRSSRPDPPKESQRASTTASAQPRYQNPPTSQFHSSFRTKPRGTRKRLVVTLPILATGAISIYLWFGQRAGHVDNANLNGVPAQATKQKPATNGSTKVAEKTGARTQASAAPSRASVVVYPSDDPLVPYFTVGSTRDDVIRVQGHPASVAGNVFRYGLSEVYFQNGRVESWHTDPGFPLKARMPQ
jgi:hypothetical protein